MINTTAYNSLTQQLKSQNVLLVAVSKMKPVADIQALYDLGQRDFGENYVQELLEKQSKLPADIRWHFIGHLQANKVKYIAPFVHLIHSVDKQSLLKEIDKQAKKNERTIDVLLQLYIAKEETKFGLDEAELQYILDNKYKFPHVSITGLMGMASFSDNLEEVRKEFQHLKSVFEKYNSQELSKISTGMSNDYQLAIEEGSNIVRIGSLLFGNRS